MECLLEQGLKLERTKTGAGEKEHAFIVKKQQYLQITACLFVAFVVVASFGFFYRYVRRAPNGMRVTTGLCDCSFCAGADGARNPGEGAVSLLEELGAE